ncbi:DHH family phosphoesterase [Corallococcus coralloides]|nr:DHH family phosphoesterase [Corallococcus coralloides]
MLLGHTRDAHWPAPEAAMDQAREFLEACRDKHVLVVPHTDVDGLTSGVLMLRALQSLGARPTARLPGKGEDVHHPGFLERLGASSTEALVVLDMGSRAEPLLPGVPTMVVDHHASEVFPPGARVLTAYGHPPVANTSLLTYVLTSSFIVPGPLEWLAVLGTVADLGADAPMPFLRDALRRAKRSSVTEAVALLNAARRSSRFAAPLAMQVLLRAGSATDIAEGRVPGVDALRDCRLEVQREVARCAKTPPRFAGNLALLLFSSEAQVHPLVAMRWVQRLPDQIVVAANTGYLPGRVNFVLRSREPVDLLALLRGLDLPPMGGSFAHGHSRATGGSLPPADFLRLMDALGFRGLSGRDVERRGVAPG